MRNGLWLIAIVTLGCGGSDSSTPANTDAGGTTSGTVPPCLASLPCQPTGACTSQTPDPVNNPYVTNSCYASGVKSCASADPATGAFVTTTYKADGTVCYKMTMTFTASGGTTTYTDATGAPFGSATSSMTSTVMSVTCNADGKTYQFDYAAPGVSSQCTPGTCTCP